ncbi:uncharacterized protein VICG_00267 [Vittaforma corneae ATCC 50505]|uniref:Uncharacterized protein n=1 Tax=Vittaforma corneae (strain ATCC 50505) TaxID=993615 RepID=L2GRJ2_VITCO|nr:uncharacterized protein VICG_00267 [Vittaforma corneae ATCC 50505]ELA42952.1 hypothetical protein VICG_00267 [Vittaforma corneae ATCC 50505]
MQEKKFMLEELAQLNDGTCVDLEPIKNKEDGSYSLIKDEIEDFISKPARTHSKKSSFFDSVPSTELKKSIEAILQMRNIHEEISKKNARYEFDRKMARIRKIKSKTYRKMKRKDKIKKEEALEACFEESSRSEETSSNIQEFRPVISFEKDKKDPSNEEDYGQSPSDDSNDSARGLVDKAFEVPGFEGNEKEFLLEKAKVVQEDAPQIIEHCLPGWGDWAGEDIEFHKNKFNTTIEKKDGIKMSDRQDYRKSNVIINEHAEISDKYKSTLPYGYSHENYNEKLKTPISLETTSSKIFNRFVRLNKNDNAALGETIRPREFNPEY